MQNRKKKNQELERQLKQRRRLTTTVFVAIAAIVVLAIAWVVWDTQNRRWIMTFEGERIAASDLQFLSGISGIEMNDFGTPMLMDELRGTLQVMNFAEQLGVGLTEEELDELEMMAGWFAGDADFITHRRIAELMGSWSWSWMLGGVGGQVRERLMDLYVPVYNYDQTEFDEGLQEYIEQRAGFYADLQVKYIVSGDFMDLTEAWMRADAGEDFDELIREFSWVYNPEVGISIRDAEDFANVFQLQWEDRAEVMSLQESEISRIVDGSFEGMDAHILVYIYSREDDIHAAELSFREQFTYWGRVGFFAEMVTEWAEDANYTVHQRALNSLT
ncbi:MAG: hypothetical protein FWB91_13995 [Defluviitaleaceae bacterium]|nr:hypothetical protein [Defluviitaleaceae bacterium]